MTLRVAVVGAGIGGLATAAALVRNGVAVEVLERRQGLPDRGTALGIWPEAVRALDQVGCGDALRHTGFPQTSAQVRRWDGTALVDIRVGEPTYLVSRPPLLGLLYDLVPRGVVSFGCAVERLDQLAGFDVVVLADGTRTRLRDRLWGPSARPRPLLCRVWRGTYDGARSATVETWGPGALWGVTPREDGRTNWFACVHQDLAGDRRDVALLEEVYADWHGEVRHAVEEVVTGLTDGEAVLVHDLTQSPGLATYVRGRTVLIGDAAHTMAPNLGRGACEAIIDGVTLGQALAGHEDVEDALRVYDRRRRRRTQRLVRGAHLMSRLALARHGTRTRDAALRLASRLAPSGDRSVPHRPRQLQR